MIESLEALTEAAAPTYTLLRDEYAARCLIIAIYCAVATVGCLGLGSLFIIGYHKWGWNSELQIITGVLCLLALVVASIGVVYLAAYISPNVSFIFDLLP